MLKRYLLSPGPTPVPERVLLDMAMPMIHHRTSEFSKIFGEVREGLKPIFGTKQDILLLAGSGTAAMEAAVVNTLNEGDKVLVVNAGKFGKRWVEIASAFKLDVLTIDLEWGRSVKPEQVESKLIAYPEIKAVLIQASETSTTAYHPIEEIAKIVSLRDETLFIVDGITSVGVYETKMDEWGIDILITGSQKAFMLPPGLAMIALSEKAWRFVEKSRLPKFYLNLKKEKKSQSENTTSWTPAVSLIIGLKSVLDLMNKEGLSNVYKRHALCAEATRKGLMSMGFQLLAKDIPSNSATGILLPEGFDGGKFVKMMRENAGLAFAGGQDHLKGKILRVSHLGYHDFFDTIIALSSLEMGFFKFGLPIELGSSVKVAEEIFKDHLGV
ncbi:MAG: alanine--glyoxylate aminotransferase family protein [Calditerrivibrio sp.]|nr:alanine--glyoxylate aminotransferase family protein [Calditerrivibrio sp.]